MNMGKEKIEEKDVRLDPAGCDHIIEFPHCTDSHINAPLGRVI